MSEKRHGFRIFHKLLLAMLLVAAIPLAGLLYSITKAQAYWHETVSLDLQQVSGALVKQVDDWVDKNKRALGSAALLPDIASLDGDRQKPVLDAMLDTLEWSYLTFTTGVDGRNIGRSDGKPPKYYGDRDYFKQVRRGRPFGYQVLIGKTSGKPALVIATEIEGRDGQMIGTIALAAHLTEVSKAVAGVKIGETGFATLLDRRGKVIADGKSQGRGAVLRNLSDHPAMTRGNIERGTTFEADGKQTVAYTRKLSNGWTLIVQQDYDDAFAPLIESKRYATILLAATLSLILLCALFLGRRLVKPIEKLTNIAGDFSRGKLDAKIPGTMRGDELGELARAVERMGVSISLALAKLGTRQKAA